MSVIDQMLKNHQADSFSEVRPSEEVAPNDNLWADETLPPIERLEAYVDHCFEAYPIVSRHLSREQVQCCVADWGRRRGQARYNTTMGKQVFGRRVSDTKWRTLTSGVHTIFVASALVGVKPEDDNGAGWLPCVRHELGHLIDYEIRGTSGHDDGFKKVMRQFGEATNDGGYAHGYAPRVHR